MKVRQRSFILQDNLHYILNTFLKVTYLKDPWPDRLTQFMPPSLTPYRQSQACSPRTNSNNHMRRCLGVDVNMYIHHVHETLAASVSFNSHGRSRYMNTYLELITIT